MKNQRILLMLAVMAIALTTVGCGGKTSHLETGGINATDLLNNLLDKTNRILSDVVNTESAERALPELQAVNEGFDRLIEEMDGLSPAGRNEISEKAAQAMPGLKGNARRLNSKRGIEDIIGPEMNLMVTKLSKLL
ncbi:MAG: hypothetical protein GY780_00450 [bacterium]|nr:hypothetical protein [bacterium]